MPFFFSFRRRMRNAGSAAAHATALTTAHHKCAWVAANLIEHVHQGAQIVNLVFTRGKPASGRVRYR